MPVLNLLMIKILDNWNREATPMTKDKFGVWEVTVLGKDGQTVVPHDSKIKVNL